jgi:Leucine-rich repeat (LRR) protein
MGDLEAALADPAAVTTLHFNFDDGTLDSRVAALVNLEQLQLREVPPHAELPQELLALPRLVHLGMTGKDDRLVVPSLVRQLPHLERLDVWDLHAAELPPLPRLRHLEIVVRDPKAEVAILAERFGHLEHLEIWGSHLPAGELPDDIERFSRLRTLRLVSCGVSTLPDAFARLSALRTFGIRGCPMRQFPEVLTRMPALATLELGVEVAGLPPSLAAMTGLRTLDLNSALNKGAMVSRWDDTSKLKPLPRVLGELVNLERLNLSCCGVVDAGPLAPLRALRALELAWSGISDLAPIAELAALEELSLASCDRIRDLAPLASLSRLRVLNLENTRPHSLDVLRQLPALRQLHIESIEARRIDAVFECELELHADEEVLERYAARAAVRGLPALAELVVRLGDRERESVETACDQLAAWAIAASSRGKNALVALGLAAPASDHEADEADDDDDDDDDDRALGAGGYLPALDLALDRHLAQLSAGTLGRLFGALFQDVGDNFSAAARIARELVSRPPSAELDAAQLAVIDAFTQASEHHDAGHRAHAHTVHDLLLDEVFPLLEGPALARLLEWCSGDHLDATGDGMAVLFRPALERARGAELEVVIARLEAQLGHALDYQGAEAAEALLDSLADVTGDARLALAGIRSRLHDRLAIARRRDELEQRLRSADTAAAALAEVARVPDDELERLRGALWQAIRHQLPPDARRALLWAWHRVGPDNGRDAALASAARTGDVTALRADLAVLSLDAATAARRLRGAVLHALCEDDYPEPALEALRTLATELDHRPRAVADSDEVQALLWGFAARYEQKPFARGLAALARLPRYEPTSAEVKHAELASMVAHLAECGEYELLGQLARQLHKLPVTGKALERILAQLIAVCMVGDDPEGLAAVMPLVPPTITWDILAYNLACKAARDGDRVAALAATRRALELGKSPDQFLEDSDFEALHHDPELLALLDAHR